MFSIQKLESAKFRALNWLLSGQITSKQIIVKPRPYNRTVDNTIQSDFNQNKSYSESIRSRLRPELSSTKQPIYNLIVWVALTGFTNLMCDFEDTSNTNVTDYYN